MRFSARQTVQLIALRYVSAHRDKSVFAEDKHSRVERENTRRQVSFSFGIHRGVRARLAELPLTTLIAEMQRRRLRINVVDAPEIVPAYFAHGHR